ncbi:MAG: EamA family transporter [Opitutaceae bacterium]|jgi:drug/metabolite transporter (DMT)-like permease|nr:EamA family transporter [Opitutaceae bacterium]
MVVATSPERVVQAHQEGEWIGKAEGTFCRLEELVFWLILFEIFMRSQNKVTSARLYAVLGLSCFFGGSDFVITRLALNTVPPFLFSGVRWGIAGLLACGWLLARGVALPSARQLRNALLVSFFLIVGGNGLRTFGQTLTGAGVSSVIMAMGPLFLILFGVLIGMEPRPPARVWGYLVGGVIGIALVILPRSDGAATGGGSGAAHTLSGAMAVLAACLCWAFGSMLSRRGSSHPSRLMAAGLQMLLSGPMLLVVSVALGEWEGFHPAALPWTSYALLAWMVLSVTSYLAFIWLLGNAPAAMGASCAYINPVVAITLSCLILGERFGPLTLAGCVLVLAMLVLLLRHRNPPELAGPACRRERVKYSLRKDSILWKSRDPRNP